MIGPLLDERVLPFRLSPFLTFLLAAKRGTAFSSSTSSGVCISRPFSVFSLLFRDLLKFFPSVTGACPLARPCIFLIQNSTEYEVLGGWLGREPR